MNEEIEFMWTTIGIDLLVHLADPNHLILRLSPCWQMATLCGYTKLLYERNALYIGMRNEHLCPVCGNFTKSLKLIDIKI